MKKTLYERYEELVRPQVFPLIDRILSKPSKLRVIPLKPMDKKSAIKLEKLINYLWQEENEKIIKSIINGD